VAADAVSTNWGWKPAEPPSLNQVMGLLWLSSALYPAEPKMDLVSEAREFHHLFYGVTPTDAELTALIEGAR
jgi:iron complex transport system substrate-binding protein